MIHLNPVVMLIQLLIFLLWAAGIVVTILVVRAIFQIRKSSQMTVEKLDGILKALNGRNESK